MFFKRKILFFLSKPNALTYFQHYLAQEYDKQSQNCNNQNNEGSPGQIP